MARISDGIKKLGPQHYRITLELGTDANGKRKREYRTIHGPRSEAVTLRAKLLADKANGDFVGRSEQKLDSYLRSWIEWKRVRVSNRTHERYSSLLKTSIIPTLGNIRLQQITTQHLDAYYTESLTEPGQRKGSTLSPATIKHRHVVIKMALKRAVQLGLIPNNPADFAEPPRTTRPTLRVLNSSEAARFIAATKKSADLLPAYLALNTGARLGEILALKWSDIDLETGKVSIRQTLVEPLKRGNTATWYSFKEPKSGKERIVDITTPTVEVLRKHRASQAVERLLCGSAWANLALVVTGTGGEPCRPSTISTRFRKLVATMNHCQSCGDSDEIENYKCPVCGGLGTTHEFDGLRFHDLRHSHATILLRSGIPPHVVSQRLGHSTVAFTLDRYAHVLPGQQMAAAEAFDAALEEHAKVL